MKRTAKIILAAAVLAIFCTGAIAEKTEVTLEGSFVWARDDGDQTGDLKAVFTPNGDDAWNVAFHFEWEGKPHVYAGTASGNLKTGELSGEVESDSEERKTTFNFTGEFADGVFKGTHGAMRDGELRELGTMELSH
ncbi:hypothetical protein ABI59_04430 [Acidobacteria bacterium Mor1]|nr:hypothetical protein ABI59_04430 [Acidobacteria bacterium Mor1]